MKKRPALNKSSFYSLLVVLISILMIGLFVSSNRAIRATENAPLEMKDFLTEMKVEFSNDDPVLVGLTAKWCSFCSTMNKFIPTELEKYEQNMNYIAIDVDEFPNILSRLEGDSLPVFYFYNSKGELISKFNYENIEGFTKRIDIGLKNLEEIRTREVESLK